MNNQEAFDKMAAHLLKQGVKSTTNGVNCRYRGANGPCAPSAV